MKATQNYINAAIIGGVVLLLGGKAKIAAAAAILATRLYGPGLYSVNEIPTSMPEEKPRIVP